MTTEAVNYLNIALMMMAALAAFMMPFETFLLAYAVLGPLHYLTEISWLHDRKYFFKQRRDGLPLILLCAVLLMVSLSHFTSASKNEITTLINYLAFAGAAVMLLTPKTRTRLIAFALTAVSFLVAEHSESLVAFFGVFLPTIVHVFVFTGAFLLLGAMRGRSKSALASLAVFLTCSVSFFAFAPMARESAVLSYGRESYAPFQSLNLMMLAVLRRGPASVREVYQSQLGLALMRFIAFAYLYHYLNWFSKTSIIKWNRISASRAISIGVLWVAILSLYAADSRTGLPILMSLSFLHGFLELPLDHRTFIGIAAEMRVLVSKWLSPRASEAEFA